MAVLGRIAWVLLGVVATSGCRFGAEQWGPFRGQVVDAESGAPIAGAYVMVSWERDNPNPVHWTQSFYDAQETTTDANGRFEVPRRTRLITAFVGEPSVGVFVPNYLMLAHEVIPTGGRAYVEPTIVKMRPLKTREDRCKYEPHGIGALSSKQAAPQVSNAIDQYVTSLRCAELRQP